MNVNQFNPERDADRMQGNRVFEMDWNHVHAIVANAADPLPAFSIPIAPHCPYRHVYLAAYNTTSQNANVTGYLTAYYQRKVVFKQLLRMFSGTAPTTVSQAGGILSPARVTSSSLVANGLLITQWGTVNVLTIAPQSLFCTADLLEFQPVDQLTAATGSWGWFLGCKSAQGPMGT